MVMRRFKRLSSWSSRHGWLKLPFDIGYPVLSEALAKKKAEITEQLFRQNLTASDYYEMEHPGKKWHELSYAEQIPYEVRKASSAPTFTRAKPENVRGIDLLAVQTGIASKQNLRLKWSRLSEQDKERLTKGEHNDELYKQRLRVWQGYEIVNYLKQRLGCHRWNPYPLLGLYPWEIIMDKLSSKRQLYEFEYDYYDVIIKEAFDRDFRKSWQLYYSDYHEGNDDIDEVQVRQLYSQLSSREKSYYDEKEQLRKQHTTMLYSPIKSVGFRNFFRTYDATTRPLYHAILEWKKMGKLQDQYKTSARAGRSRANNYEVLCLNMSIVMDYIYYCGGTVDQPADYNWLEDMKRCTNGFSYVNQTYTEKVL